jgi:hypothetical protein
MGKSYPLRSINIAHHGWNYQAAEQEQMGK